MTEHQSSPYVVGIGASAGGLDAITQVLSRLRADTSLAIVLIQHLDRVFPSELAELLARSSKLPVTWITDRSPLASGHVYVLPPDHQVTIREGNLILAKRKAATITATVDDLFCSLAEECKERAIGVILSGTGSDGVVGLRAIKGHGGLTFVQKESTAAFPGMARAAIEDGMVDRVLTPEEIGDELVKLTRQSSEVWAHIASKDEDGPRTDKDNWASIFRLIASRTGVDFSEYKQSTILRRLVRRMVLTKVDNLTDYLKLLQASRAEVDRLYQSLLINVTGFFRDPEYAEYLKTEVVPKILAQHVDGTLIRVWVPGCSTGEEAYSLGILFSEALEGSLRSPQLQIFATDISDEAIAIARAGIYSPAELRLVEPDCVRKFFTDTPRGLAVKKSLRDICIFARQNVVKDSPFSRLDLISCRNLLIYLNAPLQKRLMPIFHYALQPGGYLVLGSSESVGAQVDLFRLVDRRFRIYSRKSTSKRMNFEFAQHPKASEPPSLANPMTKMPEDSSESFDVLREADRLVLGRHGPPGALVNEELEILQFRGNVSRYLAPVAGRASLSLIKMAVEGLAAELESAVRDARAKNARVVRKGATLIRSERPGYVDIDVTPIDAAHSKERFYLVLFVERESGKADAVPAAKAARGKQMTVAATESEIEQLKQDLAASRNYVQTTIEKYEAANQELRAANEEVQSSNEELQSTNEELETAKEELQSTNEELTTVNEELHSRQSELIQLNNDLTNLINSVHLPIIILGPDMRIRRFTPMAERVLNVIPTDIGRPLSDLNINLNISNLPRIIAEVMDSLVIREMEVQNESGRWYSMRLRPYKTAENKIEGVVMTLIDIDEMKRTISELESTRIFAFAVGESVPQALVAVNSKWEVHVANETFFTLFGTTRERVQGQRLFEIAPELRDIPNLKEELEKVLENQAVLSRLKVEIPTQRSGRRRFDIAARVVGGPVASSRTTLISFQPVEE